MKSYRSYLLLAVLMVASCTVAPQPSFNQAYLSERTASPPVVGTEIAGPGTILQPLPTGVLLLTAPIDGDSFERNLATCKAFFRSLPSAAEIRAESPVAPNIIVTRWLNSGSAVASTDCSDLVNQYDYPRAARLIRQIHMEGKRGPFFAGFLGNSYVAVDGSSYGTAHIDEFVGKWACVILRANSEYTRIAQSQDAMLIPASTGAQPSVKDIPGPALILFGILKTAVQLIFAVISVFTGS